MAMVVAVSGAGSGPVLGTVRAFHIHPDVVRAGHRRLLDVQVHRAVTVLRGLELQIPQPRQAAILALEVRQHAPGVEPGFVLEDRIARDVPRAEGGDDRGEIVGRRQQRANARSTCTAPRSTLVCTAIASSCPRGTLGALGSRARRRLVRA